MLDLKTLQDHLTTAELGRSVLHRQVTASTMDLIRREAEEGAPHGTIAVAEEQSAGRGRFGRVWVSPAGTNLLVSLLLRPSVEQLRVLPEAAPLAVVAAFEAEGARPMIKWPNDVLLDGLKAAGVLLESEWLGSDPRYSIAGFGVNVNFDAREHAEIAGIATSLRTHLGRAVSREVVLAGILNELERLLARPEPVEILGRYRPLVSTIGEWVTVTSNERSLAGRAEGIDHEGRLLVRSEDGEVHAFAAGEVTLRPPGESA